VALPAETKNKINFYLFVPASLQCLTLAYSLVPLLAHDIAGTFVKNRKRHFYPDLRSP
jgi:hypothetical protein